MKQNLRFLNRFFLTVILLISIISFRTTAQTLDGTEGEVFREKDSVPVEGPKYAHWNEFDGPLTTLKIGGGILYDFATYLQDDNSKKQFKLEPEVKLRDLRFTLSGKFKFKRDLTWKAGIMYDGVNKSWFVRETGIMLGVPELRGHLFFGRSKEGYSQSKVMVGYSLWNMERSMSIDVIPILADGVKYLGFLPKQKLTWNIGAYTDWVSKSQSFSTFQRQFVARVAWLPGYKDATSRLVHIGINYRYGVTKDGVLTLKSKPEDSASPYFVETGKFNVKNVTSIGGEFYYRQGPLMLGAEYHAHRMNSPETGNPIFIGGEAFISYTFTGETRPYFSNLGCFTFLKVKKSVFDGGIGAIDGVLRFSNMDLDEGTITGGTVWRFTPCVNWYLSDHLRLNLTYGFAVLDRFQLKGETNFFQSRVMYML